MDPTYQQAMIQALLGQQAMAPGTTSQNASTPYGASFMSGNMMMPAWMASASSSQPQASQMAINPQTMQQPYSTYPSMASPLGGI